MTDIHLWEIEHPYSCETGNFFKIGYNTRFESWADFARTSRGLSFNQMFGQGGVEAVKSNSLYDFDDDLNLLWRWDWRRPDPADYVGEEMPGDTLQLFFVLQRKSYNISAEVSVTEEDEPAVRAWLVGKAEHMRKLWEPLL